MISIEWVNEQMSNKVVLVWTTFITHTPVFAFICGMLGVASAVPSFEAASIAEKSGFVGRARLVDLT